MSIINDALKKTQSELLTKAAALPGIDPQEKTTPVSPPLMVPKPIVTSRLPLPQTVAQPRKIFTKERIALSTTILLCSFLLGALLATFNYISRHGFPNIFQIRKEPLLISGVVIKKNDKTVALINNEIYEPGDSIGKMKIVNITLDQIDVLYKGRLKTFKVNRKKE